VIRVTPLELTTTSTVELPFVKVGEAPADSIIITKDGIKV